MQSTPHRITLILLVISLLLAWSAISLRDEQAIVLYCTHDLVYVEPVIEEFTRQTGIPVTIVGDTEATKSLGLVERLLREGEHSPCDVYWGNEVLGMIRLQQRGLLVTYPGNHTERIPLPFRDPDNQWFGFGGRLRVWIVNPQGFHQTETPVTVEQIESRMQGSDLSSVAIAKPLYGTTFTQFCLLWKLQGGQAAQQYHQSLRERGCQFVAGNAMVRDVVAGGSCDLGMTDTDDVFSALDSGYNVEMQPLRIDGKTICIPNTVAILKGNRHTESSAKLLRYLLSESVELTLAKTARQIPLGSLSNDQIPVEVRPLVQWAQESWNVAEAADMAPSCLEWLKAEYAP